MDRFSFSIRRVFHRLGQLGVMVTEAYGLTPARFCLMRAIDCQRQEWVAHRDVYELLGVRGPTVSRMVGRLEDCGYLERRDDPEDARRTQIRLTPRGARALRSALKHIVKSGFMREIMRRAISDSVDACRASDAEAARRDAEMRVMLDSLQSNLGDTSRFVHDDDGGRPPPVKPPIFEPAQDEDGSWLGDDPPVYAWIPDNLPLPRAAKVRAAKTLAVRAREASRCGGVTTRRQDR